MKLEENIYDMQKHFIHINHMITIVVYLWNVQKGKSGRETSYRLSHNTFIIVHLLDKSHNNRMWRPFLILVTFNEKCGSDVSQSTTVQRRSQEEIYHAIMNNRGLTSPFPCSWKWFLLLRNLRSRPRDFYKYLNPGRDPISLRTTYTDLLIYICKLSLNPVTHPKILWRSLIIRGCYILYF